MDDKNYVKTMYYVDRKNVSARYMNIGWFEGRFEIPESKITKVSIPGKTITVTSAFLACTKGHVKMLPNDYNNRFTVTITNGNVSESFEYGISINETKQLKPKLVLTDKDHIFALYCVIGDSISGIMSFEEFQSEYGYSDCCEGHKIWKACQNSSLKVLRLNLGSLYEISNYVQEKYLECV